MEAPERISPSGLADYLEVLSKAAFQTAYGIEELERVNDGYYEEFRIYVNASRVDLTTLVK